MSGDGPPPPDSADGFAARFADGRSAALHDVRLRFLGDGIRIVGLDGTTLADWPYDEIRVVGRLAKDKPPRLRSLVDDMARLEIADRTAFAELRRLAPRLERTGMRDPAQWRRAAVWTISLGLVFGGLWFGLSRSAPLIAAAMPMNMEQQIGRAAVEQASRMFSGFKDPEAIACREPDGVAALDTLTGRLTAVDSSPYSFDVRVLDIPIPNAFAAPGGYIVIFDGLLQMAETPDEVAGVLGHEIAHVTHRHATTNMVRTIGFQAIIVPLITGGTMASDLLSGLGQQALQSSYTREAETEADLAAVELLKAAGIKAGSFTDLLSRIEAAYGSDDDDDVPGDETDGFEFSIPDMLATHPATPARARYVAEAAGNGGGPGLSDSQWQALKRICGEG